MNGTLTLARIRGRKLQKIRYDFLSAHPLCALCLEGKPTRITPAVEVDHKIPLFQGGTDTDDNRQGLCIECHRLKTAREAGHVIKQTIGIDGYPK